MRSGVIAQKLGMTRVYTEAGEHVPVTVLRVDNCQVVAQRTDEKDGYTAVQLGVGTRKAKNTPKALRGHFAKVEVEPKRKVAEFRVSPENLVDIGAEITAGHFVPGQFVDVTGTSIGKGFAGSMKRHNVGGGKMAAQRLRRVLRLAHADAELDSRVAVLLRGPLRDDLAIVHAENRDGHMLAGFRVDPGHPQFLCDRA